MPAKIKWEAYESFTINASELEEYLIKMFNLRDPRDPRYAYAVNTIPLMIWGAPGVGKSAIVRQAFIKAVYKLLEDNNELEKTRIFKKEGGVIEVIDENKFRKMFRDVRLSTLEPVDLRGLPMYTETKMGIKRTSWAPPIFLPLPGEKLGDDGPDIKIALLFLDELNAAPKDVQVASYQLILDRRLGEYVLPDFCFVIAAGNPPDFVPQLEDMPSPLRNRMSHLTLLPEVKPWLEYAREHDVHPVVVSFLSIPEHEHMLYTFDPKEEVNGATPRSWEFLSTILKLYTPEGSTVPVKVPNSIIYGLLGKTAPIFITFISSVYILPDKLKPILKNNVAIIYDWTKDDVIQMLSKIPEYGRKKSEIREMVNSSISYTLEKVPGVSNEKDAIAHLALNIRYIVLERILSYIYKYRTVGKLYEYDTDIEEFVDDLVKYSNYCVVNSTGMEDIIPTIFKELFKAGYELEKEGNTKLISILYTKSAEYKKSYPNLWNKVELVLKQMKEEAKKE